MLQTRRRMYGPPHGAVRRGVGWVARPKHLLIIAALASAACLLTLSSGFHWGELPCGSHCHETGSSGSATNLTLGTASSFCDQHFGWDWLRGWNATARAMCAGEGEDASMVTCRSMLDDHMPAASAPHMLCDVANLLLDPAYIVPARCPLHRPRYLCEAPTYHRYPAGSFLVSCTWPGFSLADYSADHGRDIFGSMAEGAGPNTVAKLSRGAAAVPTPTLLVTREIHEHANLYHTLTDLMNAFLTLRMLGWQRWAVMLMDDHPPGPFDEVWARLHAAGKQSLEPWGGAPPPPVPRLSQLKEKHVYASAAFVPPGYTSLLFAHLYEDNSCPRNTEMFADLRSFALGLFDPGNEALSSAAAAAPPGRPLRVLVISRRTGGRKRQLARRLGNEGELVDALGAMGDVAGRGVEVQVLDLATLTLSGQLESVARADLLLGMHGAGLAHSLLARPGTALLELWPQPGGIWRCYEHFAQWAGMHYGRWASPEPPHVARGSSRDITMVDAAAVVTLARQLLSEVTAGADVA